MFWGVLEVWPEPHCALTSPGRIRRRRAVALLQMAKGVSAPRIATAIPLTAQAIRKVGHRYRQGVLEGRSTNRNGRGRRCWKIDSANALLP
jgi:hypothetical protein